MTRVARPATITNRTLNRLILLVGAILVIGVVAIVALYAIDRYRPAGPTMVDRQVVILEDAVRKDPQNLNVRLQLAGAYTVAERYDDALSQYNTVLGAAPNFESALLGRAQLYVTMGNTADAQKDFQTLIDGAASGEFAEEDVQLGQAYYGMAEIKLQQGDAQAAVGLVESALKSNAADADTLNLAGTVYVAAGDPAKAVSALRNAVTFVPTGWADPYQTLAKAYTAENQPDEAAWASAMVQLANGDTDGAVAALTPLSMSAAAADADTGLGLAMEAKGDLASAADWYRKALALDAGNYTATAGLGRATGGGDPHPSMAAPSTEPSTAPTAGS
jgi:tetratricopeptide (TPR) repeat protein